MQNITQPSDKTVSTIAFATIALLAAFCTWMVFFYDASGKRFLFSIKEEVPVYGSILTAISLIVYSVTRNKFQYATRIYVIALAILLFVTGAATMVASGIANNLYFVHRHDTYHYLLGPKYYPELQYNRHYGCSAAADSESEKPTLKPSDYIRNLVTYKYQPVGYDLARWQKDCPNYFGVRWEEFKHDIEVYKKLGDLKYWMGDMGYNGTPFHAYVMGKIANIAPLTFENIRRFTVIDMLLICSMITAVIWSTGGHIGMLAGIYFFVYAGDQFRITGNAYGRYMWMSLLIIGLCLLIKKRFTLAGLCVAFSMMTALFPCLFFAGLGVTGLREWVQKKRFPDNYELIAFGAVVGIIIAFYLATNFADGYKNLIFYYEKISDRTRLSII